MAVDVLVRVEKDAAYAAAALEAELARAAQLDARDRGLCTELTYGSLRVRGWLLARIDAVAARGGASLDPFTRATLLVASYQLFFLSRVPAFAAVSAAVDHARAARGAKVAGFVNAVCRRLAEQAAQQRPSRASAAALSVSPWLRDAIARSLPAGSVADLLGDDDGPPPTGIRVHDALTRDSWVARFREAMPSATFEPGRASPLAILARSAGKPQRLPGWDEGAWSVQEEGSQLVALALGVRAGERVLDACAGRGNKTAVFAFAGAEVDAADRHPKKLARLSEELRRGAASCSRSVRTFPVDWRLGPGDVPSGYDAVLLDAPCTGTGTLRRRPELSFRRTEQELAELTALQRAMAPHVASRVRPGGRLVYAVCSVLREESEGAVEALLAACPELEPAPFPGEAARALAGEAASLRLMPHVHGTDGYFLASFRRAAGQIGGRESRTLI